MKSVREAKRDAYLEAYEAAEYDLTELISPDDVEEGSESWDDIDEDTLADEVSECVTVMSTEGQLDGIRNDLAVKIHRESLTRAPMDDLVFDTMREAVRNGYWPHTMNKWECEEHIQEIGLDEIDEFHDSRNEADEAVYHFGAYDKMHPFKEKDPDRF